MFTQVAFITNINAQSNVAINASGNPDVSAILDISSTTKGLLIPRVDPTHFATLAAATASPANGLMVYNTTTNALNINTGTAGTPVFYSLLSSNVSTPLIYTTGTSSGTASGALNMQASTNLLPGYLTTAQYATFTGKQDYLKNTTTASLGFVKVTTTAGGVTTPSYDQSLNYNISTGSAGYYPKYTATNSLGNSLIYENGANVGINLKNPTPAAAASSSLQVLGSFATAIQTVTAAQSILDGTYYTILVNSTSNPSQVTLVDAATCLGRIYVIKNISNNAVNVMPYNYTLKSSQTIDGVSYYHALNGSSGNYSNSFLTLSLKYVYIVLQSDGTSWYIIGSGSL